MSLQATSVCHLGSGKLKSFTDENLDSVMEIKGLPLGTQVGTVVSDGAKYKQTKTVHSLVSTLSCWGFLAPKDSLLSA